VRTVHKDGSVTVEPFFTLDANGQDRPGFIGGKVRLHREFATPLTFPSVERAFEQDRQRQATK
jgi:hypothetical protein